MGIQFNGSTTYLDCGNVLNVTGSNDIAVGAWVVRGATGARHEIISKEGTGVATGWELSILASGVAEFGVFNGATYPVAQSTTTFPAGTLRHVAGTYNDTTGQIQIWVDGVLEATTNAFTGASSTTNLNVGRNPDGTRYFNGTIEDLRVYNRVPSLGEMESWGRSRGRDQVINGLQLRLGMLERAPGTVAIGLQNLQQSSNSAVNASTQTISSYTIPANLPRPVLVVCAMGDDLTIADTEPVSCTFGGDTVTKRQGANTTATAGSGSAIFTREVSSGQSGNIVVTWPNGIDGRIVFAYVVPDSDGTIDVTAANFNNSGATTTSFTTTGTNRVGLTACSTGENNPSNTTNGAGHVEVGEILEGGNTFSGVIGQFAAPTAGAYNGYGFNFTPGTNRSSQSMIALHSAPARVDDQSENKFHGTMNGTVVYTEGIAA